MTSLFKQLEELIPTLDGWSSVEFCQSLAASVIALRPDHSVIIGIWGGRDTFALGLAHKLIGKGFVTAIDPWSPAASEEGQDGENKKWWGQVADHELVYNRFTKNLFELGLGQIVRVHRAKSDNVEPVAKTGILIIDGNHGPQAEKDQARFCPSVISGGLVYCDDLQWQGGSVLRAVATMKAQGYKELYRIGTGAMFMKP